MQNYHLSIKSLDQHCKYWSQGLFIFVLFQGVAKAFTWKVKTNANGHQVDQRYYNQDFLVRLITLGIE